jgi:hypothetical protein
MPSHAFRNADKLFILKDANNFYYGIIDCMGAPTVLATKNALEANCYDMADAARFKTDLAVMKILVEILPYKEEKVRYSNRVWHTNKKAVTVNDVPVPKNLRRRTTKDIFIVKI